MHVVMQAPRLSTSTEALCRGVLDAQSWTSVALVPMLGIEMPSRCWCMQVRDAGSLLTAANFTLQTVDAEDMTLEYDNVADPIQHLRVRSSGLLAALSKCKILFHCQAACRRALMEFDAAHHAAHARHCPHCSLRTCRRLPSRRHRRSLSPWRVTPLLRCAGH
jgi:hypothetical protein